MTNYSDIAAVPYFRGKKKDSSVQLIIAQFLTAFVAVFLWRRQWAKKGFFPTFVPVVSVAPAAVLALNGSILSIVGGALLGAIVAPPLAAAIAGAYLKISILLSETSPQ
jgi:uncharacterized membrane protein